MEDLRLARQPVYLGHVSYVSLGPQGQFMPPEPIMEGFWTSLLWRVGWYIQDRPDPGGSVVQIQLLDISPLELSESQRSEDRQLLSAVVAHVLETTRPQTSMNQMPVAADHQSPAELPDVTLATHSQ